jgi:hypothetical protein
MGVPRWRFLRRWCWFLVGAGLFAAAYCQAPLYYSNQNQYFLHGLAQAGEGFLARDWLAQTLDPTPVFSAIVTITARYLHPWLFYVYYGLLFGIYAASMVSLFVWCVGDSTARRRWPVFIALFLLVHAALPRWCSYHWLGRDYPWYLQAGVAGQYVLGCMFQPSTFGVLLIAALCLFARQRPLLAGTCVAFAATLHSTYLLAGAMLTLGFVTSLILKGQIRRALVLGAWTLLLVIPITSYIWWNFHPTSPTIFAQAQEVLVTVRIPHHSRPDLWLDGFALLQVVWVVLALVLVRRTSLFAVLAVPFCLALALTLVQVWTGNTTLALLFPWRVSTILVPAATTIILARITAVPVLPLEGVLVGAVSQAIVAVLVIGGIWISVGRLALRTPEEEQGVMAFVREHKARGDAYLVPVRDPGLADTVRGAQSTDFKPLQERRSDRQVVPVDFQCFRLATGAPLYIEFKAIPYNDAEVLEWRDRIRWAESVQEQLRGTPPAQLLGEMRGRGITHLIVPVGRALEGPGLECVHRDAAYQVYRLTAISPP